MSHISGIKIITQGTNCSTEVYVNGQKVEGVRKVYFKHEAGESPIIQMEFLATDMAIDAKMIPALPEVLKPFYTKRDCPDGQGNQMQF